VNARRWDKLRDVYQEFFEKVSDLADQDHGKMDTVKLVALHVHDLEG